MTKKYEFTDNTKEVDGHTLHQIKALKAFGDVEKGELGGWVENYNNLSQLGIAWVYGDALVYDNAKIYHDASVYDNAQIYDSAMVYDNAQVFGNAKIYNDVHVYDNVWVYDNATIYGNARFYDNAKVYGNALVNDSVCLFDNAQVYGDASVCGNVIVRDIAKVYGDSDIQGNIFIRENDEIKDNKSYIIFKNTWSSGRQFVYVLSNKRWHVGCFDGSGEDLIKKAYSDSELSGKMYEMYVHFAENVVKAQQQNKDKNNVQ